MTTTVSSDFKRQLRGYGLTTAQIWYTKPDAPWLINPHWYLWQEYDLCPKFPELFSFLDSWRERLDGKPVIVKVSHRGLVRPAEINAIGKEFRLN